MKLVIALGGNAILRPGHGGGAEDQFSNIELTCKHLAGAIEEGHQVLITHGNGPQVGNLLIQNQLAAGVVPAMPLSVCGAQSQGMIGYMVQQTLHNYCRRLSIGRGVVSLITQTLVDPNDPAFQHPTKPIGPFLSAAEAERLRRRGAEVMEDSGRGWRTAVPSPRPLEVVEKDAINALAELGFTVVAAGGGGIAVVRDQSGNLHGVDAVIDKDLASQRLANDVGAEMLIMLTAVEKVALNYGKEDQVELDHACVPDLHRYYQEGHFAEGSMAPKIKAAMGFIEEGGERAIITSLEKLGLALLGAAGTIITAGTSHLSQHTHQR